MSIEHKDELAQEFAEFGHRETLSSPLRKRADHAVATRYAKAFASSIAGHQNSLPPACRELSPICAR